MIKEKKAAVLFINSFIYKLKQDGKDVCKELKKIQIFTDPSLRRQRKQGIYGWIDYEDENRTQISSSVDWEIEDSFTLCAEDIMGFAMVYAKEVWTNIDNFITI